MRTTRRITPREPVRDQRQIVEVAAFEPPLRRGRSRAAWAKVRRSSAESRTQADMRTSRSYGGRARVHRSSRKRVAKPRRSRCGITPSPWRHEDRVVDRDSLSPATGQLTSGQNCVTAWLLFDRVRLRRPQVSPHLRKPPEVGPIKVQRSSDSPIRIAEDEVRKPRRRMHETSLLLMHV
jgi:hypothetical protein